MVRSFVVPIGNQGNNTSFSFLVLGFGFRPVNFKLLVMCRSRRLSCCRRNGRLAPQGRYEYGAQCAHRLAGVLREVMLCQARVVRARGDIEAADPERVVEHLTKLIGSKDAMDPIRKRGPPPTFKDRPAKRQRTASTNLATTVAEANTAEGKRLNRRLKLLCVQILHLTGCSQTQLEVPSPPSRSLRVPDTKFAATDEPTA